MNKLSKTVLCVVLALALTGCGGGGAKKPEAAKPAETYTIKVTNFYAADHPINQSVKRFQQTVESKTGGKVKVQNFPNSALGSEEVFIDSVKKGTVQMGIPGTMLSRDVPAYSIVEMPFLFVGWEHARKVLTGPIAEEMNKPLIEKTGMRLLGVAVNGMRVISSGKAVNNYDDLKGLRLRVPNVPYYVEMVKAFGGVPTTLPLSEVFNALEQKVVDGQDNPYPTVRASKFYEVQKYMLESNHMFSPANWVINEKFFQSLPKEYQAIVVDAAKDAIQHNWEISMKKDQEDKNFLQEKGLTIVVPDKSFRDKLQESQKEVYTWFYNKYPGTKELADKIRAVK